MKYERYHSIVVWALSLSISFFVFVLLILFLQNRDTPQDIAVKRENWKLAELIGPEVELPSNARLHEVGSGAAALHEEDEPQVTDTSEGASVPHKDAEVEVISKQQDNDIATSKEAQTVSYLPCYY